jgi:hypothetical protein
MDSFIFEEIHILTGLMPNERGVMGEETLGHGHALEEVNGGPGAEIGLNVLGIECPRRIRLLILLVVKSLKEVMKCVSCNRQTWNRTQDKIDDGSAASVKALNLIPFVVLLQVNAYSY